ncbi:MAG: transcriptional repressor [Sphaerochaetaceae bacterium]|nr:transcriptional repressor [Spirochaetales bacterium]MDY5499422.1 transcriptional repressor [Sphaerochaetaceae bacterium]
MIPIKSTRETTQRDIVYQEVLMASDHPVAETIYQRIHAKNPKLSRSTVYRNLHILVEQGKILSISVPKGPEHFDRTLVAHYHVQCDICGAVSDIVVAGQDGQRVVDTGGYTSVTREVLYHGICPNCKSAQEAQK